MKKTTPTNSPTASNASRQSGFRWCLGAALLTVPFFCWAKDPQTALHLQSGPTQNREAVFTNKRAASYQTQTHRNDHPEHAWFRGFTIAAERIFSDARIRIHNVTLEPAQGGTAELTPAYLRRVYPGGITETLRLFDNRDVVMWSFAGNTGTPELELQGDGLQRVDASHYVRARAAGGEWHVAVRTGPQLAVAAVATSNAEAQQLAQLALQQHSQWTALRERRMRSLISGPHALQAGDATTALHWITLSMDSLVTAQRGDGIYAGLPWFQEYWGRDSFIALPGATLVTGQFEVAARILRSFAAFQNRDPQSPLYGRLPNIVKPSELDYHTTDGTPRFVMALRDYVDYSGDIALARTLYPVVSASIEGALSNFTDSSGYLLHADNETWMDARREPDKASYSPRANRANDIQALWVQQLEAGVAFANLNQRPDDAARWQEVANRVRSHFSGDFVVNGAVADHLNPDGSADTQVRPNALFAFDLLDRATQRRELTRLWPQLVYPWGVATLAANDPGFLPYHWAPGQWHKDAAYHNGTIWPWLDGIAMQRMIEQGRPDLAWPLFQFNLQTALATNGSLPETMDAHPRPGSKWPRFTGTHSQAWSLSEQLRVWHQNFVGIRPQLSQHKVTLAPRLPGAMRVDQTSRLGVGTLRTQCNPTKCEWTATGIGFTANVSLAGFRTLRVPMRSGDTLIARLKNGKIKLQRRGLTLNQWQAAPDPQWKPLADVPMAQAL